MATTVADHLSAQVLAYVGDAVHDLFVRSRLAGSGLQGDRLHQAVVAHVRATTQSQILGHIEPLLTEEERDYLRRGRNIKGASAQRRRSTALEALFGWLYLTHRHERLNQLLETIFTLSDPRA